MNKDCKISWKIMYVRATAMMVSRVFRAVQVIEVSLLITAVRVIRVIMKKLFGLWALVNLSQK